MLGPVTLATVLVALAVTTGLRPAQWATAAVLGVAATGLLLRCLDRARHTLTPADLVTLVRCVLACAVAGLLLGDLLVGGHADRTTVTAGVVVAVLALLTDPVDGRVARRAGPTAFGGRFDGEADAFLILVLAGHVASTGRPWVLVLGAARYLFGAGELWVPWFRAELPFRWWRKVVAATQGIVLTAVTADVLPGLLEEAALLVALALLVESFGRDVLWLWRRRTTGAAPTAPATRPSSVALVDEVGREALRRALAPAQRAAFPPGEYVGQESFMGAGEIRALAAAAGVRSGTRLLDLCCGTAGPGRHLLQTYAPRYLGVDASPDAVRLARERTRGLDGAFVAGRVPPLPPGPFDVVLLLETFLAFEDKDALVGCVARELGPGGRFAFTLESGPALSADERARMPAADTVRLQPFADTRWCLRRHGLRVVRHDDVTSAHLVVASALLRAYEDHADDIAREVGHAALDELVGAHRLWVDWMAAGRVRKLAVVAEKVA